MVRVILIVGASRSGTTLVDRLLGEATGAGSLGEVNQLWTRGLQYNQLCGCGVPFRECGMWCTALNAMKIDDIGCYADVVEGLRRAVIRNRRLPFLLIPPALTPRWTSQRIAFRAELRRLYEAVAMTQGVDVIIDSSKHPVFAHMIAGDPNLDLSVLHVVRDARAVAFSSLRRRRKPEVHDRVEYMRRLSPQKAARSWMRINLLAELLRPRFERYARLRLEDLARNPQGVLSEITQRLQLDCSARPIVNGAARLSRSHTVSGNPMRFETGLIPIRDDSEWRMRMDRRDRRIVSWLSAPLLLRYGYLAPGRGAIAP
jgi:hypothetical protein